MSSEDLVPIPLKPRVDPEKAPHIYFLIKHENMEVTNHATGLTRCMTTNLETILATITKIRDVLGANHLNITQGCSVFSTLKSSLVAMPVVHGILTEAYLD
jgi:hypothetical protein